MSTTLTTATRRPSFAEGPRVVELCRGSAHAVEVERRIRIDADALRRSLPPRR